MRLTALIIAACCGVTAWAQAPARPDKAGCVESKIVTRMPGCVIIACDHKDYSVADVPLKQTDRTHKVEGQYEMTRYHCPREKSPLELGRNTEGALKNAGYNIHYTYLYATTRFYMTAQKGAQWAKVTIMDQDYELIAVKEKEMAQVMTANAEGWAAQINQTGRATVYGINFDTGKATIKPESAAVLAEVAKLLQANSAWAMMVAGHTDNVGAKEMNLSLSRQRAEAVMGWLAGQGIDKSRLVAAGFGDTRPVAENTSDDGRQKNRRVDLVKVY
jgi:OmpA-OmpF porin, OOP family